MSDNQNHSLAVNKLDDPLLVYGTAKNIRDAALLVGLLRTRAERFRAVSPGAY